MSTSVLSLWPLLLLRALVLQVRAYPTLWGRVSASDYAHDKPTATVPWWRDLLACLLTCNGGSDVVNLLVERRTLLSWTCCPTPRLAVTLLAWGLLRGASRWPSLPPLHRWWSRAGRSWQNMMLFYVRVYTGRSLISGLEVMLDATTFNPISVLGGLCLGMFGAFGGSQLASIVAGRTPSMLLDPPTKQPFFWGCGALALAYALLWRILYLANISTSEDTRSLIRVAFWLAVPLWQMASLSPDVVGSSSASSPSPSSSKTMPVSNTVGGPQGTVASSVEGSLHEEDRIERAM